MNLAAGLSPPIMAIPEVIFHVSSSANIKIRIQICKFTKNLPWTFPHDVRKNIQAGTMRHPKNNLLDAMRAGSFYREIQQRNQALCAFERETLCSDKFLANELFKYDGIR